MKKKRIIPINYINLAVVLTVTLVIAILTQNIISELTIRDIKNVTRLTYTNIYAEITQELAEPVNTSVVMAQNTLLFDFMDEDTPETESKLAEYLSAIQEVTGYESVFVIPDSTLSYYHPGGTDAKVDLESDDAYWYTARIDAKDYYGLVVNTEQLDDLALTIYVDANINDKNGNFAGIAGVGKRIIHLQDILTSYLENQGVEAYIVKDNGLIMVHKDNDIIKNTSFYDLENIPNDAIDIPSSQEKPLEKMIDERFYIIHHIPMIDWYLVVKKSTSELTGTLSQYSIQIITALVLGAMIILIVTNYAISMYKNQIISLSNIDHLTDIPNRTIFESNLSEALRNTHIQRFSLALFDLDNLKHINDSLGHDKGDYTLKLISELATDLFDSPDCVSRVGGDEFAVILYRPIHEAQSLLEDFQNRIKTNINLQKIGATVSVGITESKTTDTETDIYKRADEALYRSKKTGKDKIHIS
ncbi:diguanylate cyclase domain-containing protein [Fusibacter sp. JL216-2]|uniref:sensor domain-containing diguanylate cyclase n=1 Tax=Fusibacter sp. JL216-2 TaxID=3071453 RepID=UPI003D3362BD